MVTPAVVAVVIAAALGFWAVAAHGQSSRRDRYRRESGQDSSRYGSSRSDGSSRTSSGRPEPVRREGLAPQISSQSAPIPGAPAPQEGRITGPAEPNRPAPRHTESRSTPPRTIRPSHQPEQDEQWTQYKIIVQRNIFDRNRQPMRTGPIIDDRPRPVMPNPESYLLLRGIVQENGQFLAFVEDKQSGSVLRLRAGDHVARGTIKSLNLDGLEYQLGDKTTGVRLGYDLEGGHGALTAGDLANYLPMAAPAGQSAPSAAPAPLPANADEILKRLMERRQQSAQ